LPNQLRIALAGSGGVVRRYRGTYRHLPGVQVVATIDVNEQEARQAAAELGAGRASTDFADALRDDVDAVVISTPNHLHAEHAVAAFDAGKHVLLQKPMARTAAECDTILAAQRRSGRQLGVYMNLLDHPLFRDMRRLVSDDPNLIGQVMRPQPVFAGGKMRGFRVYPGANRQAFARIGLRAGDLVTAINGTPLDDKDRAQEIFSTLNSSTDARVTVTRNGRQQELVLNIAQIAGEAEQLGNGGDGMMPPDQSPAEPPSGEQ